MFNGWQGFFVKILPSISKDFTWQKSNDIKSNVASSQKIIGCTTFERVTFCLRSGLVISCLMLKMWLIFLLEAAHFLRLLKDEMDGGWPFFTVTIRMRQLREFSERTFSLLRRSFLAQCDVSASDSWSFPSILRPFLVYSTDHTRMRHWKGILPLPERPNWQWTPHVPPFTRNSQD